MNTFIYASCGTKIFISPEDFDFVSKYTWHITTHGYARTQLPRINGVQKRLMLHRVIVQAKAGEIVDHINRIKIDNRRDNLRIVSPLTNSLNRKAKSNGSSKFKGITRHKNKWQVYVNHKYVGLFLTEEQAALAYDSEVLKVFGAAATTNQSMGLL